ncbi:MAG TPA: ATP synthase F1 subunit delta [Longimicrobiaceae bacterium]|nr:ATP synthase F1 subunit delta [Longimicrobiaceae bacterium]
MRAEAIARNYAETLLALAQRHGGLATAQAYLGAIEDLATLLEREPRVREFLETPRVSREQKQQALRATLAGRVPDLFLRFTLLVVEKGRQGLFREIALAYRDRVDELLGQVRVQVAISHEPDALLQEEIRRALEARLGKKVIAEYRVDPELLGGLIVRMGDEILDGSVRSRAAHLRRRLLETRLPAPATAA